MTKQPPIQVFIADDHDMLREGLSTFLKAYRDLELVGEASNGAEAVRLCKELQPDVVLMDLIMPEMDGVTAIGLIHNEQPDTQIIALSSFGEDDLVRSALQAGATSYILKNVSFDKLADAIRATKSGFPTLAPEVAKALIETDNTKPLPQTYNLTSREQEVLSILIKGVSNAKIAQKLGLSPFTVKNHVRNILSKLGVASRAEAISLALQEGVVQKN